MKIKESIASVPRHFWLSHHPICSQYKDHTFLIGKTRFCIGCFIGFPAGVVGVLFTHLLIRIITPPAWVLFMIATIFISTLAFSFTGWTKVKSIKILQKFSMGFGSGIFLTIFFYISPGSLIVKWILTLFLFSVFNTMYNGLHIRTHNKICDNCEEGANVGSCSGYAK